MKYTEVVKQSKTARLELVTTFAKQDSVNKNTLTYSVEYEGERYSFLVPIEDLGTANILPVEKSLFFARWIRLAIEKGTFTKI